MTTLRRQLGRLWVRHGDTGVAFVIRVASAVLVYGLQVYLARQMALEAYGTFVSISTWIIVLAGFAVMGFGESALRFLPRYVVRERWGHALRFFRFGLAATIGCVTLAACVAVGVALQFVPDTPGRLIIILVAIGLPFAVADFFLEGVGRAMGWYKLAIVPTYIVQPLLIGAIVWVLVSRGVTVDAVAASLVLIAVAALLTTLRGAAITVRMWRDAKRSSGAVVRDERNLPPAWRWHWLRASLPLMVVYGVDDLLVYSDILLLGLLATPQDVGVYIAAVRSLAIANFIHYAFMLVAAREFSVANSLQDRELLQERVADASRMTFLLTVPAVVVTLLLGYPLLRLFGEGFVVAYPAMIVLGLGLIVRSFVGQAFDLLAVMGHARAIVWVSFGCLVANVALSVLLIPMFGILGAAAATAVVMALRAGCLAVVTRQLTGLSVVAFGGAFRTPAGTVSQV